MKCSSVAELLFAALDQQPAVTAKAMKRSVFGCVLVVSLIAAVAAVSAHSRFRIVGTVTKITGDELTVKRANDVKDNPVVEMDFDEHTKVVRNGKTVSRAQIKVGASVVIDALGDSILDLVAQEIRLVPPISTKKPE